ncbi:MAG: metal-sulfur cluster assembly factor [Firmicutes bacterium]|nr:metal-sulfur cluster assembly factor [Bacillota bacterium]MCL5971831.1 metal-sulfur cluster assembly factor [Bacillota bacterium]
MVTEEEVKKALESVCDPEIPISVWDLGLVTGIQLKEDAINVQMTLTSLGCGCVDWIVGDVEEALQRLPGVAAVHVEVVWNPSWKKERMTARGRMKLEKWGVKS